jgi:alkanesulfonate monooxygenase SsuD/methylene tetrahydromethanopterin reductase-like flavin-dependent oxidoreductase (luciferase family)
MDELDRQLAEIVRHWDEAPEIQPKPLQRPHPPIIVGGTAKPRTIRAAIAHADEYNTVWPTVDEARERRRRLDDAAQAAGREQLVFSMMTGCVVADDTADLQQRLASFKALTGSDAPAIAGTVDQAVGQLREYEAAGVDRVMLQHIAHEDVAMVDVLGKVAAQLG